MASTAGLVPITRTFLAAFYAKHPFEPLSDDVATLKDRLTSLSDALDAKRTATEGESASLTSALALEPPHKLDENFWKNREQIEEILFLLDDNQHPPTLKAGESPAAQAVSAALAQWRTDLTAALAAVERFQASTSNRVSDMVFTYMPQDFRGTLLKVQKERSEARRQAEVAALVANGGSIKQKYALLWQQQMDRRHTLASLGAATGVYRTLVTYLVGVPQVLLDFVKTINEHDGPMEEQRLSYGPPLYALTALVNRLHIAVALWWATFDDAAEQSAELVGAVSAASAAYSKEITRYLSKLTEVFEASPFLISAEDAMSEEDKSKAEEFKELAIQFGQSAQVPVTVDAVGTLVAWEFNLTYGKDIGFSVDYTSDDGNKTHMVPYQKVEKNEGSFNAPATGSYIITWDNTYSLMTRKVIRYKVGAIPPVETQAEIEAEEALAHPEKQAEGDAAA
eukprot:TRINITY_DN18389_c0_g3_i1.p1 TRINITY_DN18389_c0_g3~~TRINITY_DN18389_c0_g3_i1.p1  ORF type:complete len:453 (+),score=59.84 TRINITY_DN18389_c0_g3_i1:253-1611(+)